MESERDARLAQRPMPGRIEHLDRLGNERGESLIRSTSPLLSRDLLFHPASHYPRRLQGILHPIGEWIGEFEVGIGVIGGDPT